MDSKKQIVLSMVNFLKAEVDNKLLDAEKTEGLEVAIQILEETYDISRESSSPFDLLHVYESRFGKSQISEEGRRKAEELKVQGNELMKAGQFNEAITCYTLAIEHDSNNAVYFCNRAAAYTKSNESMKAVADCEKALVIDPGYSKAYGRMGLVYLNEKNYRKALESYEKALALEPNNTVYKNNLEIAKEKSSTPSSAAAANPLAGMDLNAMLSNPAVINMAQNFMQNPQMQNMFASMMGGGAPPTQQQDATSTPSMDQGVSQPPNTEAGMPGGMQLPEGLDFGNIMNATQSFAQQMQQENPDLVNNLRSQFQQGQHPGSSDESKEEEKK